MAINQLLVLWGIEDVENITWQAPGLNHNIWLTHFYYKGQDLYPRLDEWIANEAEDYWAAKAAAGEEVGYQMSPAAIWQYKMMGLMPIGDTPRTGGWWATESAEKQKTLVWWQWRWRYARRSQQDLVGQGSKVR